MNRLAIFCEIDDFCRQFEPKFNRQLTADGTRKRIKPSNMSRAEVMTIVVVFHRSGFRDLKTFQTKVVCRYWHKDFRNLLSYNRFVELERSGENLFLLSKNEISNIENRVVKKFADYPKTFLTDNFIFEMEFDKQNNLWAGTFRDGIDVLNTDEKPLKYIKTKKIREIIFLKSNGNGMDAATTNELIHFKSDFFLPKKTICRL